MAAEQSHIKIRDANGVKVVEFADRKILEELSIHEIGEELSRIVSEMDEVKLLLCFKNVEHLSSAALGMLINLNKLVNEHQGQLKLSDIAPPIFEVFKITRLNRIFNIFGTAGEALADFSD